MSEGKVAIVTAASRGIGEGIARELHRRGYRLTLMSRSGCAELAQELGALGVAGDVTREEDIRRCVDATLARYGRIDAAVSNSGRHAEVMAKHKVAKQGAPTAATLNYDPDFQPDIFAVPWQAWHDDLDLVVLNCLKLAKAVTPHMQKAGGGAIVNISGMESVQPRLCYLLGPIRLALHGFTKIYSDRYGPDGIRMNCVLPGMIENAAAVASGESDMTRAIPLRRYGGLKEIAQTVAFLLSEESGYITGQLILADGGLNRAMAP